MNKKIISVVALSSVLGIGAAGLASCKPEIKEVIKEVEKPVYYYGVSLNSTNDVKLTSEQKNAKVGETVKVKVELINQAYGVAGITVTGNIQATKVEGEDLVYEFTMPETSVTVNAVLKSKEFNIKVNDDDAKGKLRIYNVNNQEVKKAKAGQELLAIYEEVDFKWMPKMVKANDEELYYDSDLLGYSFHMPAKDLEMSITYQEAAYQLYSDSAFAFTSLDASFDDTSLIYTFKTESGKSLIESGFGMNTYEKVKPGERITIEVLEETYSLENRKELLGAEINGKEIKLTKTQDPLKYTFEPFNMPAKDSVLSFKFDETKYYPISYTKPESVDVKTYNPFTEETSVNPEKIKENSMADFIIEANGKTVDLENSGIFELATGKKLGSFTKSGEKISCFVRSVSSPISIVVKTINEYEGAGLVGDFTALESINAGGSKKNALTIKEDGSFEFMTAANYTGKKAGQLAKSGDNYVSTTEGVDLTLTPVYEYGELRLILARYKVNQYRNAEYFAFTRNVYSTIDVRTTLEGATVSRISLDNANYAIWAYADADAIEVITFKNFEEELNTETVYEIISSKVNSKVKFDGEKLVLPGAEAGKYNNNYVLDGFGGYTKGAEKGTYTIETLNNIIKFSNSSVRYVINTTDKTLTEFVSAPTILTGLSYTFKTAESSTINSETVTIKFGNNDSVTLTASKSSASAYKVVENEVTIRTKTNRDFKFSFDPVTYVLTATEGYINYNNDLTNVKANLTALDATFTSTDVSVQDQLVLSSNGTYEFGATSGTYSIVLEGGKFVVSTSDKKVFELDLEAKKFTEKVVTGNFFDGKTYTAKIDFVDETYNIEYINNVTLTFKEGGTNKFNITMNEDVYDPDNGPDSYSHETIDGTYTYDQVKNTISLSLNGGKTLRLKADPLALTLKFDTISVKIGSNEFYVDYNALTSK